MADVTPQPTTEIVAPESAGSILGKVVKQLGIIVPQSDIDALTGAIGNAVKWAAAAVASPPIQHVSTVTLPKETCTTDPSSVLEQVKAGTLQKAEAVIALKEALKKEYSLQGAKQAPLNSLRAELKDTARTYALTMEAIEEYRTHTPIILFDRHIDNQVKAARLKAMITKLEKRIKKEEDAFVPNPMVPLLEKTLVSLLM